MKNRTKHSSLWFYFIAIVYLSIIISGILALTLCTVLYNNQIININPDELRKPVFLYLFFSIVVGCVLSFFVGKLIINPVRRMDEAFKNLEKGDFDTQLPTNERVKEINGIMKNFNTMTSELSRIEVIQNDFISNVSHEFKTPLSVIEGYVVLLQKESLTTTQRNYYTEKIISNLHQISNLTNDILLLSKMENQETLMNQQTYYLDEQLRQVILLFEDSWSAKNIEFDLDLPECRYYGSESLLRQVWYNLLENAIKFSSTGDTIKVSLFPGASECIVSISDNGIGISNQTKASIFNKFYQGDTSRKSEGNGLGLALVKRIVELHTGEIAVYSEEDEGTTFIVTLPINKNS